MAPQAIQMTNDEVSSNNPMVDLYDLVARLVAEAGFDVSMSDELLAVPAHSELVDGYVIPDFMTDGTGTAGEIRDGRGALNFTLRETGDGEAKDADKSHFVAVAIREGWTFAELVEHLLESGQFETAAREQDEISRSDVSGVDVAAYAVATYLKGVLAERVLTDSEHFSKAGIANDQAGQDVYVKGEHNELRQVKCVTVDSQNPDHIYYQFDCRGNLWFGENCTETAAAAVEGVERIGHTAKKECDLQATVVRRTDTKYTTADRPHVRGKEATYRYIGW